MLRRTGAFAVTGLLLTAAWSPAVSGSAAQQTGSALESDVRALASDEMEGRAPGTAGSTRAQDYIIDRLDDFAVGLDQSSTGVDAFRQEFAQGVNILALIPGDELPDEYVMLGAHYDHLGTSCATEDPNDTICNGATDNATGVAAVLSIGERIAQEGDPDRSVILALWDAEEIGLLGSRFYVDNPVVPLEQTVSYVNFDIQGAEILPSLAATTFAIGAETGGDRLASAVQAAVQGSPLDTHHLSWIFGQGRSDYFNFIQAEVPTVFFSDSTGPCYHTAQDDVRIVNFDKLGHQVDNAHRLTRDLVDGDAVPGFVGSTPTATYEDAVELRATADRALADVDLFTPEQQDRLLAFDRALEEIVAAGPAAFGEDDVATILAGAANAVDLFTRRDCLEDAAPAPDAEPEPAAAMVAEPAFTG
jgi:hypothetical protein